jgi:hypothetical protein
MVEILVSVKSVPAVSDNVAQLISSLPVTVKLIGADDDVAAERASVTVGGVVSGSVVVVVDGATVVDVVDGATAVDVVDGATVVVGVVAVGGATVVDVVAVGGATVVVVDGATVVVVVGGATVVVVVGGATDVGSANHLIGEFSHQHRPVTGQRITPVSLSAQPSISLLLRGRARRVPLIGHVLTYAAVISRVLVLIQNFGGTPRVDHTNLYSAPKIHPLSMLFLNVDVLLLTQTETTCGCFALLCAADATPLRSPNSSPIATTAVQQRRKNNTYLRYELARAR